MSKIERPKSLTELVYDEIKREIVEGELGMGEALSEASISTRLDVSRTPVRAAFARLELEGLVHTESKRGTFVFSLGQDELRNICDVRVCLETAAMASAFERDRTALVDALTTIVEAMAKARKAADDACYLVLDTQFHQALFDNASNPFLDDAYQTIAAKMAALRNRLGAHPDHMAKSFAEHQRIVDLIRAGDLAAATEVLVAHIGRKEGSYWNK